MRCETATTETRRRRGIRSYGSWELNPGGDVMVGIVVLVVCGLALVVGVVLIMTRLDRRSRREFQRRRDAWEAAAGVGPSPGEGLRGGGSGGNVGN
jgi:hypothetical protein